MHTKTHTQGFRSFKSIAADKPFHTAPSITREFTIDGTRMYETADGRQFNADLYDRNFKVTKGKVLTSRQTGYVRQKTGR